MGNWHEATLLIWVTKQPIYCRPVFWAHLVKPPHCFFAVSKIASRGRSKDVAVLFWENTLLAINPYTF